ncbi:hypothetical protein QR680_006522 [Steinernema hermaphroditum]|uniref:Thyroglobulin type-1 domain-containing protein n=1 Tax=Steinernema hermaphroditum TaxID=289476 RepID=A0AA39HVR0_9BILA|nr:hypothetical protein QR680_006522 [Steinernema hermaphroditum]
MHIRLIHGVYLLPLFLFVTTSPSNSCDLIADNPNITQSECDLCAIDQFFNHTVPSRNQPCHYSEGLFDIFKNCSFIHPCNETPKLQCWCWNEPKFTYAGEVRRKVLCSPYDRYIEQKSEWWKAIPVAVFFLFMIALAFSPYVIDGVHFCIERKRWKTAVQQIEYVRY